MEPAEAVLSESDGPSGSGSGGSSGGGGDGGSGSDTGGGSAKVDKASEEHMAKLLESKPENKTKH